MARRQARNRSNWQEIVTIFQSSNQSISDFCRENDLVQGTFSKWYYKLRNNRNNKQDNVLPVQISSAISSGSILLSLSNGSRLEFDGSLSLEYATSLIKELNQC